MRLFESTEVLPITGNRTPRVPSPTQQETVISNISKYIDLAYKIKHLWNLQSDVVILIVILSLEVVPKTLLHSINSLGLPEHIITDIQKFII